MKERHANNHFMRFKSLQTERMSMKKMQGEGTSPKGGELFPLHLLTYLGWIRVLTFLLSACYFAERRE